MRQLLFILTCLTLMLGFTACSTNDEKSTNDIMENENIQQDDQILQEDDDVTAEDDVNTSQPLVKGFEEVTVIKEEIDIEGLHVEEKVNTKSKRILLFINNDGHLVYKSIYMKENNFLKIIDTQHNQGEVFHGKINL